MQWWRLVLGVPGAILAGGALVNGLASLGMGVAPGAVLVDAVLVGGPGLALVYGAWRLPHADVDPDLYPRVALWCFGLMGVMMAAVALAFLRPEAVVARPFGTALSSAALGGSGGLAIGLYEGRAVSRSRERAIARRDAAHLRRRNEHLEKIQSAIAHDVKSPLTGLYGNLELARDTGDLEHLDDAEDAAKRIEALVEDLGRLAREGVIVDDPEPVALHEVVHEVWHSLETGEASLDVDLDDDTVLADERRLQRLVENLLRNALAHAGPDVHVTVGRLPNEVGFYVEDDGPGFPTDDVDDVLEVGFTTHDEGTGFGLPIVTRIARSHGWDVQLREREGGGARVEVWA